MPVEPVRTFPISDPDRWIAICDSEGRELVGVADVNALPADLRGVLERDLARREFVPQVRRILRVPVDAEPTHWEVETDRGPTRFVPARQIHQQWYDRTYYLGPDDGSSEPYFALA